MARRYRQTPECTLENLAKILLVLILFPALYPLAAHLAPIIAQFLFQGTILAPVQPTIH
jgi:hypothetical protein